jgi:hypothetical protein
MIKSTSLCLSIVSPWKFVIKNEISYPFNPISVPSNPSASETHIDRLPPQNHEILRPHGHKPRKLLTQDPLNLIRLLDGDGYSDRVDGWFDEDAFGFVSGDDEWVEEDFDGCSKGGWVSEGREERDVVLTLLRSLVRCVALRLRTKSSPE